MFKCTFGRPAAIASVVGGCHPKSASIAENVDGWRYRHAYSVSGSDPPSCHATSHTAMPSSTASVRLGHQDCVHEPVVAGRGANSAATFSTGGIKCFVDGDDVTGDGGGDGGVVVGGLSRLVGSAPDAILESNDYDIQRDAGG